MVDRGPRSVLRLASISIYKYGSDGCKANLPFIFFHPRATTIIAIVGIIPPDNFKHRAVASGAGDC